LARFGITGDTALQKVGQLSGGERCRAALARLAATDANLLVLDEPTNHLDLWARDSLERALNQFQGTILFVSHDRYFVDRVADHLLIIEPGGVRMFEGNYSEFQRFLQQKNQPVEEAVPTRDKGTKGQRDKGTKGRQAKESAAAPAKPAGKKRRFPYRKVEEIETEVHDRETRLKEIHDELAFPETHRNGDRVRQLTAEAEEITQKLKDLYAHWEEASELNW
jgi:ATP-binding cassette subfamily F protein 3